MGCSISQAVQKLFVVADSLKDSFLCIYIYTPLSQADGMVLEMKFLGILTIPNDGYSMVLMGKIGRSNDVLDSQKMVLIVFHTD